MENLGLMEWQQMIEHLHSKHKALNSNPSTAKKKKKKGKSSHVHGLTENFYCENDYTTESSLHIQSSSHQSQCHSSQKQKKINSKIQMEA
jgi:hypothetical protein